MRNKILLTSCLLICILLLGCKESNKVTYVNSFPNEKILSGTPIRELGFYNVCDLTVVDSFLIILNKKEQDKKQDLIQIYNLFSNKLLLEKGSKGRGPGEFIVPTIVKEHSLNSKEGDKLLVLYDLTRKRITQIDIEKSLKQSDLVYEIRDVPNNTKYINQMFYINDSLLYYEGENAGRFSICNLNNLQITNIPYETPNPGFKFNEKLKRFIFKPAFYINPKLDKIVTAPLFIGRIDFFNTDGNYLQSTVFESTKGMESGYIENATKAKGLKRYIVSFDANENIYALSLNLKNTDVSKVIWPDNEILVFDWNGIPIEKLKFDRYVDSFVLDTLNKRILGYCPYSEDYSIFEFKLN